MQGEALGCVALHSSHSVFKRLIHGYCFQILLRVAVQNQIDVLQRSVIDQPIKLRSLIHIVCHFVLHRCAVDGDQCSVCLTAEKMGEFPDRSKPNEAEFIRLSSI